MPRRQDTYTYPLLRTGAKLYSILFTVSYIIIHAVFYVFAFTDLTHEMRRLVLVVNDVNLFTDIRHQHHPIILKRENQ